MKAAEDRRDGAPRIRGSVLAACLSGLIVGAALAHPSVERQLERSEERLSRDANDAGAHVRRGNLYRRMHEWDAALAEYETAERIDPDSTELDLLRGLLFLEAGWARSAEIYLDRFLVRRPEHPAARLARGRARVDLDRHGAGAADIGRAIARMQSPQPQHYLEWARALVAAGRDGEAVQRLDEGIERLGPIAGLYEEAIEIETRRERYGAALRRIDRVQERQPERWLVRRGEILEAAGRDREAMDAYRAALAGLQALAKDHRSSKPVAILEQRARRGLERLAPMPAR